MGENKKPDPTGTKEEKTVDVKENEKMEAEEETAETIKKKQESVKPEAKAEENAKAEGTSEAEEEVEEESEAVPDEKDRKIAELDDRFKRLFAEFDNFRKRTDAEKSSRYMDGERAVLEKVLPLIDNFERALASVPAELEGNSYVEGMEKVYRSFMDAMSALGVTPIEAVGQPFNADLHNAVMHIEDEEVGEGIVVEEFQKGYMFKDKVLRYSMVKVAN